MLFRSLRLMRLKDKLGNWANASSEVEFAGALAWRIGDEGRGVATILEMVALTRLDPQGRLVWARIILPVGATVDPAAPLAVFVSAKASSEVWLDGVLIGANGAPAATAAGEIPGRMDAVFPIPAGALAAGQVTLDLRMSSHRGLLRLSQPVHIVALGPYQPPRLGFLDRKSVV